MKLAATLQLAVMAPVVKVLPLSEPPQPVTALIVYPLFGVTVKLVVLLTITVCGVLGVMLPPAPALGVTVNVIGVKEAVTVQLAVMAPVV